MLRTILQLVRTGRARHPRGFGVAPTRQSKRWVPGLEALESRYAPSCTAVPGDVFKLNCSGAYDRVVLDEELWLGGGGLKVTVNDDYPSYYPESMSSVEVNNSGSWGVQVYVLATLTGKPLTINGAGSPAFRTKVILGKDGVDPYGHGGLGRIRSPVNIINGPSYTELTVDNANSSIRQDVTLEKKAPTLTDPTNYHLIGLTQASAPINWVESDVSALTIWGSTVSTGAGNTYTIANTPQNSVTGGVTTKLYSGGGSAPDTVHVQQTTGALDIDGLNGLDNVDVGNATNGLDGIHGKVTVRNWLSWSALTVNDTAGHTGRGWELSASKLTFTLADSSNPGIIDWGPNDIRSLTINMSNGFNQFRVYDTPTSGWGLGLITTINASSTYDAIHVQKTSGHLIINGGNGTWLYGPDADATWKITDNNTGTITSTALVGDVAFNNVGGYLGGGTGNDRFVFADGKGFSGTIDGGGGRNMLDYSPYSTGVYANLELGSATNIAGGSSANVSNIRDVVGGAGNDILVGDGNGNTLDGGPGGRDLIIGGRSGVLSFLPETLIASAGATADDCILIAGYTDYDQDFVRLKAILDEWVRTDLPGTHKQQYDARVDHVRNGGGLNGQYLLNETTVHYNQADDLGGNILIGNGRNYDVLDLYFGKVAVDSHPFYNAATETWVEIA
jgi:hypothetical protein